MPTPLITNFTINTNAPIDSRMIASNATNRDAIAYKYDGMQVFTTDTRTLWTYNATTATWSSNVTSGDGNGIYGGSGSLVGNTYINTGSVANTLNQQSNYLILSASASNKLYFSTYYNRHDVSGDWKGVEFIQKLTVDGLSSSSAYISYNPNDPINNSTLGLDFGTSNIRRMSITGDGILRLWSPTYSASFISSGLTSSVSYTLPSKSGTVALISDIPTTTGLVAFYDANYSSLTATHTDSFNNFTSAATCIVFIYLTINSVSSGGFIQFNLGWVDPTTLSHTYYSPTSYTTTGSFAPSPITIRMGAPAGAIFTITTGGTINYSYGIKVFK